MQSPAPEKVLELFERASCELQHAVASPRELKIMGDQDRRQVTPFSDFVQQIEDHLSGALIQISGRLVREEQ